MSIDDLASSPNGASSSASRHQPESQRRRVGESATGSHKSPRVNSEGEEEDVPFDVRPEETPTPTQADHSAKALGLHTNGHEHNSSPAEEPHTIIDEHGREMSLQDKERTQTKLLPEQSWR